MDIIRIILYELCDKIMIFDNLKYLKLEMVTAYIYKI